MYGFQYKHGDRPLEGYTIQRAAGRGGFGEVYYAVSDSGREVALKVVSGFEQIELRGISQCMNLKSPHLVTVFDVKHNEAGRPFVVMEFVSGPNLRQILDEHPGGLGTQKAAFFLREIGKGLTFLHDCGIVHRDLKPANIFYENGYVKIGDYGLSKLISASQHSNQTVTVGTVHYMAPEVGQGRYDRSIDIYALGALLYELLTGVPPFVGSSPSEVLMKHLSAEPDLSGVAEPFASTIRRAMAKDPSQRFATVQEMVESIFGAEHIRESVSVFRPEELSVVAARVARAAPVGVTTGASGSSAIGQPRTWEMPAPVGGDSGVLRGGARASGRLGDLLRDGDPRDVRDPLEFRWRVLAAAGLTLASAIAATLTIRGTVSTLALCLGAGMGLLGGSFLAWRFILPKVPSEDAWLRRLAVGGTMAGLATVLSLPALLLAVGHATMLAMLIPFFFMDMGRATQPTRPMRVNFWGFCFLVALFGFIASAPLDGTQSVAGVLLLGTSVAIQLLAPWDPKAARAAAPSDPSTDGATIAPAARAPVGAARFGAAAPGADEGRIPAPPAVAQAEPPERLRTPGATRRVPIHRPVPRWAPAVWAVLLIATLGMSLSMFVWIGNVAMTYPAQAVSMAGAVALLIAALWSLIRIFTRRYYGAWDYLVRPVVISGCLFLALLGAISMGGSSGGLGMRGGAPLLFFPLATLLVVPWIPGRRYRVERRVSAEDLAGQGRFEPSGDAPTLVGPPETPRRAEAAPLERPQATEAVAPPAARGDWPSDVSPRYRLWSLLLAACWFGGLGGLHRFYAGKIVSGIIWLLTGGLFGIGQLIDAIMLLSGTFRDKEGRPIVLWDAGDRLARSQAGDARRATAEVARSTGNALAGAATGLLGLVGGLMLAAGALAGVAAAVDAPGLVAAGFPDPQIREELNKLPIGAEGPSATHPAIVVQRSGGATRVERINRINLSAGATAPLSRVDLARGAAQTRPSEAGAEPATIEEPAIARHVEQSIQVAADEARRVAAEVSTSAVAGIGAAQEALDRARIGVESAAARSFGAPVPAPGWSIEPAWVEIGRTLLLVFAGVLGCTGLSLIMLARRREGGLHVLRAVAGTSAIFLAILAVKKAIGARDLWPQLLDRSPDRFLQAFSNALQPMEMLSIGALMVLAMVLFSLPARRRAGAA